MIGTMVRTDSVESCRVCAAMLTDNDCFSFGDVSICNCFLAPSHSMDATAAVYPLNLAQCRQCGLIQLVRPAPVEAIRPRVPWLSYNEPDKHLDALVAELGAHFSLPGSVTVGVGPFEAPLLARIAAKGGRVHQIDLLALADTSWDDEVVFPYLETMQEVLSGARRLVSGAVVPKADLVSCRYLLEHCRDPVQALRGLTKMLTQDGLLLIEVPDSTSFLARQDYSFLWEEHCSYFTEQSFRAFAAHAGFEVTNCFRFQGQLEEALIFLLRPATHVLVAQVPGASELYRFFCQQFGKTKQAYIDAMQSLLRQGHKLAILGAGHQTIMLINLFDLGQYLSMAVDDHPGKRGCRLPGTQVDIVSMETFLADERITICLLGVNPAIESNIMRKCERFIARKGQFYSLYPSANMPTLIDKPRQ